MKMRLVDLEGLIWHRHDVNVHQYLSAKASRLFHEKGVIYAPLRRYINVDRLERFRSILFLRDPRDVLVSHYYSMAFSHGLPANSTRRSAFLDKRNATNVVDINQYVLKMCDTFLEIYQEYCRGLVSPGGATILLYDTFINDFRLWVSQLAEALQIETTPADVEHLWLLKGGDVPSSENVYAHVRSGETGSHKHKLSIETRRVLDNRFSTVLESIDFRAASQPDS